MHKEGYCGTCGRWAAFFYDNEQHVFLSDCCEAMPDDVVDIDDFEAEGGIDAALERFYQGEEP